MIHHVHEVNFSTYPWLMPTSDLILAQTDMDRKYSCLERNQWLTEEVIEEAVARFCCRSENLPSFLFFDSFIFPMAKCQNVQPIANFAFIEAINHDFFTFLVNPGAHWLLTIASLKSKYVFAVDSLVSDLTRFSNIFSSIFRIIWTCFAVARVVTSVDEWKFSVCKDVPPVPWQG